MDADGEVDAVESASSADAEADSDGIENNAWTDVDADVNACVNVGDCDVADATDTDDATNDLIAVDAT